MDIGARERIVNTKRVVVVGGGIAGVCAALHLAERGVEVTLIERNGVSVGGRVARYPDAELRHQGELHRFPMEHGIHGWWRQYRNFLALIERLGLSDRMIDAYDQTLVFRDSRDTYRTNVGRETQITPVPEPFHHVQLLRKKNIRRIISASDLPRFLTLGFKLLESVMFEPDDPAHLARYDDLSVREYTDGVPFFYRAFLGSLTRSGFFSDPPQVSLWAFLIALQHYVFLRREDQRFSFTRGPIVPSLLEPMLERIRAAGGRVVKGVRVSRVQRADDGGWYLGWARGEGPASEERGFRGRGGRIKADQLVLAVDVAGAAELLERSPALEPAWGDLGVFEGRPAINIRCWWSRAPDHTWGESGVFAGKATADNYFWLHRFQDAFAAWHRRTGGAVSECHIYAPASKHALPDQRLLDEVLADMENALPDLDGACIHQEIIRNRPTHINFPVGCAGSFPTVETPFPDLHLCGDWVDGGVAVLYMERACQTGIKAANGVLEALGLEPFELLGPVPPPPHIQRLQRALRRVDRRFPQVWPTRRKNEQGNR
jgi:isorenieratene synthase